MMRIAVVSDSHGDRAALQSLAQRLDNVEKIIHLGDCVPDGELLSAMTGKQVLGVKGNCDFSRNAPEERLETLGGAKLLICHGHRYQVKSGLLMLGYRAREVEADVALFGHTHCPAVEWYGQTLLINPGSLSQERNGVGRYTILEFRDNGIVPVAYTL